jgi:DNA-binding HxlR family transcriptional regulator
MLAERLKGLEAYELVERKVFAETPVRVEYHLTDRGRALGPVFAALGDWANKYGCGEAEETDPNAA